MAYTKEQAAGQFDKWSNGYNKSILQSILFGPSHNCFLENITEKRPFRLLDVGCGTGVFLHRVLQHYPHAEVWGLDYSGGMLQNTITSPAVGFKLVQGDSERLPLSDSSFDIITCANSFHHYPNQQTAVEEMHRVLRPGGRLMIIDGFRDRLWGRFIYDLCVVAIEGAVHHNSADQFRTLFRQAGFADVRQKSKAGLAPFLLTQGTAAKDADSPDRRRDAA